MNEVDDRKVDGDTGEPAVAGGDSSAEPRAAAETVDDGRQEADAAGGAAGLDAAGESQVEPEGERGEATPEGADHDAAGEAGRPEEGAAQDVAGEPAQSDRRKWFIIHTYSGFENKVLQSLRQRADAYGMGDKIGEILVPTEDVAEIRDGKKVVTKKKIFPGYVLVHMEMSDEAWHVVRSTPKVTGFLGSGQRPLPMPQDEVDRILNQVHVTKEKPKPKFDYRVGETVKITDGPFSNFTGVVEEVNEDRATLKVMVSIFGRATPVELEFHQVKRPD